MRDGRTVEGNNADHNGQSYIVKMTKPGRPVICNKGHIWKKLITAETIPQ